MLSSLVRRRRRATRLLALALLAGGATRGAAAPARPNVLLIVVDDLRFDDIGPAGHPFVRTPNIDRLAREGARFLNAFATTPLCSPSRASILTGLYAHRHGIVDNTNRSASSHALLTFPRRLQQAGYETAFIGKWHMGNDDTRRPGFDYWVAMKGQGQASDPLLNENGTSAVVPGYVTDIFTERALDFLGRRRERPFCLLLAHKALHPDVLQRDDGSTIPIGEGAFVPAERHRMLYARDPLPRRGNYAVPPRGKPALERRIGDLPPLGASTVTHDEAIRDRLRGRPSWSSTGATRSSRGSSAWATMPSARNATSTSATGSSKGWTSSSISTPTRTSSRISFTPPATLPSGRRWPGTWAACCHGPADTAGRRRRLEGSLHPAGCRRAEESGERRGSTSWRRRGRFSSA